ncbi:pectate lyase [Uliginosibacterium sp. H3]|uniref:Pectate lyase n=1 Tax=Uliginosibacterium silvisoli TaxID=3114758 RepID=A0ABU6K638_9RHOO|nr:pectate lyase [Uliginosibacterium sp. H3]
MITKLWISMAAALLCMSAQAATDANGNMVPTGRFCANLGDFCSFNGKMVVHIAGCKSTDKYNGGCASGPGVIATNGIRCTLANFGMKAPLPDVGPNACYLETLAEASVVENKSSAKSSRATGITGARCASNGSVTVDATIVVNKTTYDGECKTFSPGPGLRKSGSETTDKPMFRLESGATLKNVMFGENSPYDEAIHVFNGATLDNIRWGKLQEKAVTIKSAGDVVASSISATNGNGLFQVDAPTTLKLSNCTMSKMSKVVSQSKGARFNITVFADRCELANVSEAVFVSDSAGSVAKLTNSYLRKTDVLCKGSWATCPDVGNFYD